MHRNASDFEENAERLILINKCPLFGRINANRRLKYPGLHGVPDLWHLNLAGLMILPESLQQLSGAHRPVDAGPALLAKRNDSLRLATAKQSHRLAADLSNEPNLVNQTAIMRRLRILLLVTASSPVPR